jgi:DNA mismatch endonuclease (patch repair protein)
MSSEKRSALMSKIKGKNTGPEVRFATMLSASEQLFETHAGDLPGTPDFVFRDQKVAVFVDGDFWHGWRFSTWRMKLSEAWDAKIEANRKRDARNHRRLRRSGWVVIRVWEHQLEHDATACVERVLSALSKRHAT